MDLDQRDRFTKALLSDGPHPALAADDRIFAPLIGSWSLRVRWFDQSGRVSREDAGEWHFAWVLEGRAIQDIWIVPPVDRRQAAAELYEYGSSLRFYDSALGAWQSTWIGPMHHVVRTFVARRIADRIVLETPEGAQPRLRWSFADIAAESFTWTNEHWEADGWRLTQSFDASRRGPSPPAQEPS
jgi:hypothetical protein